jgi:hypothetical protein
MRDYSNNAEIFEKNKTSPLGFSLQPLCSFQLSINHLSYQIFSTPQHNKTSSITVFTYLSNHSYSPSTVSEGPFISTEGWRLVMASMTRCTYAIPTSTRRTCITFLTDRAPQLMATLATASIHPGRSHVCMDINTNTKLRLLIESTNLYLASCTKMLASPPSSTYIYG